MAGNKINTKTKSKDDKNKANSKVIGQNSEDCDEPDFALLRKPIVTSVTGFGQARKIFDLATEELKDLISNECDLLYECKVCRNMFRSLANFISHKRVFCKEKFNSNRHSHFIKSASLMSEITKIKYLEKSYQEALKVNPEINEDEDDRIPLTKDLTSIIEKIAKKRGVTENNPEEPQISLQKIPNSSVAMFQNMESREEKQNDNMRAEVNELDKLLSQETAILEPDGNFKIQSTVGSESENVIQISDDDENDNQSILKCKICDMQFSTKKTLKFHMKYKHVESRLVYSCPDCFEIFATSWSVYRHLFKVHRKTAAQIRRLRESIQSKAFKMNNPPASYEKRRNNMKTAAPQKITEEERRDQENQAWMDNLEGDGELPRCGGCGRTFERRAALAAHTHTCQPRSRALARRPDTKKIEIQIRKDYNKGPPAQINLPTKTTSDADVNKFPKEPSPVVLKENKEEEADPLEEVKSIDEDTPMEVSDDDLKSSDAPESPEKDACQTSAKKLVIRLPFDFQAEKGNFAAFRQRIRSEIEESTLTCKKCDSQSENIQNLYDHIADHIKWVRYACKLCNFKHYSFDKLPEHVKVVHKLKGDKDFYFSTVKAVDGTEALEICEPVEEREVNEIRKSKRISPDSRHPSRCSSDSSRISDDSSSSSARVEGVDRKRKLCHTKQGAKRRKAITKGGVVNSKTSDFSEKLTNSTETTSSTLKSFEDNSSDMDDLDDRLNKKQSVVEKISVESRRPVRRKAKPKHADFEYDLSNLLKMEAQGYRDSISMNTAKSSQSKKKQQETLTNFENFNKECCGALITMAKKSVEISAAHMKTNFTIVSPPKERPQNVFLRPMVPKTSSKGEKSSPKKDVNEDVKDNSSPNKNSVTEESPVKENNTQESLNKVLESPSKITCDDISKTTNKDENTSNDNPPSPKVQINPTGTDTTPNKPTKINIPAVVPIKFRRQSLEVMKSPLINKNISDFTKAGMKTKILVIKPINRDKDGKQTTNAPLKFQTIKLKDPNKNTTKQLTKDQVVVVKVPKVVPMAEICSAFNEKAQTNETPSNKTKSLHDSDNANFNDKVVSKPLKNNDNPECIPGDSDAKKSTAAEDVPNKNKLKDIASNAHEETHIEEEQDSCEKDTVDSVNTTQTKD